MAKPFWEKGIRFECQGTGRCCTSRGSYGYVYLTLEDRRRLARLLKLATSAFTRRYCRKTDGYFHLSDFRGPCQFLRERSCSVYEARPVQCRTWPFWPENMNARSWKREVVAFCPGVGKGRLFSKAEIQERLDQDPVY
ncbi:MAG: YkgJ family cysteine cluster protein [Oligoflexia bacterium]|nr:YkgJ family cysteine cluster protein [Oligoflexia bacterium]